MSSIPEDILLEFLLRLPVKSLIRFKLVRKSWCALIESPEFVYRHYRHESNPERLLVKHYKTESDEYSFRLYSDATDVACEEPDHLQFPSTVQRILGPLNGIYCIDNIWSQLALLNPATRQFRLIPLAFPEIKKDICIYKELSGFGIDPLTGDFKVVTISLVNVEPEDTITSLGFLIFLYNSSTDSWRQLEYVMGPGDIFRCRECIYSNGVCYWLECYNATECSILAFDMSSEKFRRIEAPPSSRSVELSIYHDSIALLQCTVDDRVDVWAKSESCWIKILTVGPFPDIFRISGFWKNCELLLEMADQRLHMYNLNTQELRSVEARKKWMIYYGYEIHSYKESLVSVKREGCWCGPWLPLHQLNLEQP